MSSQPDVHPARRRPSAWAWLVTGSALLIAGAGLTLTLWWAFTNQSTVATYGVNGAVDAITLDLATADAEIVGGGERSGIEVRRTDEFAFGRRAMAERRAGEGVLAIRSRCPPTVLGVCRASYRLTVPDNLRITMRTTSGSVRFTGFRGSAEVDTGTGDVSVAGFCGFALRARSLGGDVTAGAACAVERLELRSRTGDVRAVVPPARYQIDADSDTARTPSAA